MTNDPQASSDRDEFERVEVAEAPEAEPAPAGPAPAPVAAPVAATPPRSLPPPPTPPPAPETETELFAAELARVRNRRETLEATTFLHDPLRRRADAETVGLALSGGGIRSATISLGILRALGRARLLPYVDYVSSVSGGSYIAAFLCSRYVPSAWRGDVEHDVDMPCSGGRGDPFSGVDGEHALDHLRQSGRYLLPTGANDAIRLAALTTRSWLAIQLVLGVTLLAFFLALKLPQVAWLSPFFLDVEAGWANGGLEEFAWPSLWMRGFPLSHWFVASWLFLVAGLFLFVVAALFCAYFLTRGRPPAEGGRLLRFVTGPGLWVAGVVIAAAGAVIAGFRMKLPREVAPVAGAALRSPVTLAAIAWTGLALALLAVGFAILAQVVDAVVTGRQMTVEAPRRSTEGKVASPRVQEDRVRYLLTRWTTWWLSRAILLTSLALFDSIAQTIYARLGEIAAAARIGAVIAISVPVARQLLTLAAGRLPVEGAFSGFVAKSGRLLALVAGLLIAAAMGVFWATLAQWLAWWGGPIGSLADGPWIDPRGGLVATVVVFVAIAIFIGWSYSFLNLSTFANFYASSLRRAYLGASNVERWRNLPPTDAGRDHIDDDVALDRYYHPQVLAPLHLINVTINDTASAASSTTQRDRRGKPLVVSPFGYLFPGNGIRAGLRVVPFAPADPKELAAERLPLSTWVGISGAAASTGMGQYGSLGLSLLAGLANLRLGYWWDPGAGRGPLGGGIRAAVQWRLFDELGGRFPGSDGRRWYLTDGGHFENSGAYELVRRRVGLIVLCDNGADPDYQFGDLVTLTRRIRIDFDAELTFVGEDELDVLLGAKTPLRQAFGTVKQLGMLSDVPATGPYAAIGRIRYGDPAGGLVPRAESTLLLVKPRVCGQEAADLVAYARTHKPFPQQTTLDQNFEEAQWESYYRLGQIMGDRLFAANPAGTWHPLQMRPLP